MAWDLRKLNKFSEAAEVFSGLQKLSSDPFSQYRYQFWEAESWRQAGQVEASVALFNKLIIDDPLGYYGLLSYKKLDLPLPSLQSISRQNSSRANEPDRALSIDFDKQNTIRTLVLAEEPEVLSKYIFIQFPNVKTLTSDSALFILTNLAEAGLYQPLFSNFGALDINTRNELLALNPELIFPKKFAEIIQTSALKFNIPAEFIFSIIRQESAFDPYARSPVDAFGLMQLLPNVARLYEKNASVHLSHHEDLYVPEVNIPLGSALIANLLKKYKGQILLTAAAYNANEKAIANWLNVRLKRDPLEFIEDIPYEETRSYMKLILRNYVFYTRMSHPDQKLFFPEDSLSGFKQVKAID
jgi:soluble lytic murein transglycosylase